MPPVYDTYSAVRRLVEAGVPESQAAAMVSEQFRFVENIATKDDIAALKEDIATLKVDGVSLKSEIFALKENFALLLEKQAKAEAFQQWVVSEFAKVRAEQQASEARIIKHMTGLMLGVTGSAVAILGTLMTLLKIF